MKILIYILKFILFLAICFGIGFVTYYAVSYLLLSASNLPIIRLTAILATGLLTVMLGAKLYGSMFGKEL